MPVAIPGLPRTATSIVDLIGNTPLIRLSSFEAGLRNVELYAKAEWKNPGGSVKDRPALRMIQDGEKSGALPRDKIILDATSGNRAGHLLLRRPVQQSRELALALRHHRARDHRADRRPHHAFHCRPRHERHVRRCRPQASRIQHIDSIDLRSARLAAARPRRAEAHGDGDRARHLRHVGRR